jgi:hypothetical protein
MASLDRNLRKDLENAVKKARRVAEAGARQVIEQLAVNHHEPWSALTPEQRKLRNRLRVHGRQLGDRLDDKKPTQSIRRLAAECAYEQWHRLLFARFLAENNLLVEPDSGMALSLDECRELARERGVDWLVLASDFAQRMLPQIFRSGDPVLEVSLPPETRQELEGILEALPQTVFLADDSLGWVYQFWQADEKARVNVSEKKIGAEELPAVTQLFTEDYMVLFLLHNTLGAWWAGKVLSARPELGRVSDDEQALRDACSLRDQRWEYLRFARRPDGSWAPAAGAYESWPRTAKEITLLDPSMGSGHFLVFAMPILCAFRIAEEDLDPAEAIDAVLRDNLFGLELDARCTQIAAFNLALTAWRITGHRSLPKMNLACSGLTIIARENEWLTLAGSDLRAQGAMKQLHSLFQQAPVLGSLIDPSAVGGELFASGFSDVRHLLDQALRREGDEARVELAVAAQGVFAAAELLVRRFTLVITNVPYLGRGDQDPVLADYCETHFPRAKADLATSFLERAIKLATQGGSVALVTPQNWLFLKSYKALRENLLRSVRFRAIVRIGEHGFESTQAAGAFVALSIIDNEVPSESVLAGIDAARGKGPAEKATSCRSGIVVLLEQAKQRRNPDSRLTLVDLGESSTLDKRCESFLGLGTGDFPHYGRCFWEVDYPLRGWAFLQSSVDATALWSGREHVVSWDSSINRVRGMTAAEREQIHNQDQSGQQAWGKIGVAVGLMRDLKCTLYTGEVHEKALAALIPDDPELVPALWALCSSREFHDEVRKLDNKVIVANGTLVKIPFDVGEWEKKAKEFLPSGLPSPVTDDPTQWIFDGNPASSAHPLQVAVARLCGYRWPRQRGVSFWRCDAVSKGALVDLEDSDGIVCTQALRGEAAAAERVRTILASSYGDAWSPGKLAELLQAAGGGQLSLDEWLRDRFFEQHCNLFHQSPFIWHISDGLQNGFSALVSYHKLIAPNGEGRRTLEKLIYTYLGDWIDRQRADRKAGAEGADGRVAAAEHLKRELERILEGESPYDIFARWRRLHHQPVGWAPDIDDGVRINIRPFMTAKPLNVRGKNACILRVSPMIKFEKDRGKDGGRTKADYPWFWGWDGQTQDFLGGSECDGNRWNDLHYSRSVKLAARERSKGVKS